MLLHNRFQPYSLCAAVLIACTFLVPRVQATPVVVDGNQWMQVADFTYDSWYAVANVCDPTTGMCSGNLNGHDVTGWTWASVSDVGALFQYITSTYGNSADAQFPGGSALIYQDLSGWAPAIFDVLGFTPTDVVSGIYRELEGILRTTAGNGVNYVAVVDDFLNNYLTDDMYIEPYGNQASPLSYVGAFFFRPASPVPAPPTVLLFASGLAGIMWRLRRRRV